jgi:hypothetical protein
MADRNFAPDQADDPSLAATETVVPKSDDYLTATVGLTLARFAEWLSAYGETSWDHQSFFAGPVGRRAKALYYQQRYLGTAAVAPMIFCEAFLPSARRLYHHRIRFPIADAHYAMGFAFLYQTTGDSIHLQKAIHFLNELKGSRCPECTEFCWGYPFDWVWRGGVIRRQTPLITSTPYGWEAFLQVYQILQAEVRSPVTDAKQRPGFLRSEERGPETEDGGRTTGGGGRAEDRLDEWKTILESIARHAVNDIKDFKTSATASSCSYTPFSEGGVINAAAYRAFLLTSAAELFGNEDYWKVAERNLNFVLENQSSDGSWFYAIDGVRDFVDHYHTCFVMKALAKIHTLTGHEACGKALKRGLEYYSENLFDEEGLPKPFSKAPRLTVYKRELYDCAECINLCLLLRDRFPVLETTLHRVVGSILNDWVKPDGSFRSRRLHFGWDNVPMHRWGQAQMFRSLAFYLRETAEHHRGRRSEVRDQKEV